MRLMCACDDSALWRCVRSQLISFLVSKHQHLQTLCLFDLFTVDEFQRYWHGDRVGRSALP